MNNFFFKFKLLLFSFLGIGFIRGFRAFLTSIISMIVVLLIPDEIKTEILIVGIIVFITFFAFVSNTFVNKIGKEKLVFKRAVGIWIASISPFVLMTWFWAIVCLSIYFLLYKLITNSKLGREISKYPKIDLLKNDIMTGLLTGIILQILYSAAAIFPFIIMFWQR